MKYYFLSTFILIICSATLLNAQTDLAIRRNEFRNDKTGFEDAWKNIKSGDDYYLKKGTWYGLAFDEYVKAMAYNSTNAELNYKTGVSALFSDRKEEAAGFLIKAGELKNDITDDFHFLTGRALQYSGRYDEAIEHYNIYLNSKVKKSVQSVIDAKKYLDECGSALNLIKDTLKLEIKNMGSEINSYADDYSQILSSDGKTFFFASRRELPGYGKMYDDTKFDENIFVSVLTDQKWSPAQPAGKTLNTKFCESPLFLTPGGEQLYIYAGYENNGDIKVSRNRKGKWMTPVPVQFRINSSENETSFCISPSGLEIWFVSNRKDRESQGGKDLYYMTRVNEKKWSKPVNAGPMINTPYDEESISFSSSGDTLWFGSKGHDAMGGYDIFYSVKNHTGGWDKAVNSGFPVNTPWDELFYIRPDGDDSTFLFVSNRAGGMGGLDIYKARLLPPVPVVVPVAEIKPDTVVVRDTVVVKEIIQVAVPVVDSIIIPEPPEMILYLTGKVNDSETGEPVMAKIDIIDFSNDMIVATTASSDVDGTYRVRLPEKKAYMVDLRGSGFLSEMKRIDIPENYTEEAFNLDVSLIKVKVGKKVVLNNILFETGKSILTTSSYSELDRLLSILQENPLMKIEISGHTDKTGSEPLNFKLSEDRAKAVVEYLIQKGIDKSRLEFRGYGSLQPIADNATPEGRTQNRRVEFKILEF